MLTTEWNWDVAKQVWYEEGREEGKEEERQERVRKALAEGVSEESIQRIFGLDKETIKSLSADHLNSSLVIPH